MHLVSYRGIAALLFLACVAAEDKWSWGAKPKEEAAPTADVPTTKDGLVDDIINSGRQGRNLQGYDEIYADPGVQDVLKSDNYTQARHLIKDRLCDLGLASCDEESIEPKRPNYISPQEVIYAQPVGLKPVGRPITAIPIKSGHSLNPNYGGPSYSGGPGSFSGGSGSFSSGPGYGPPRPVPFSPSGPGPIYSRPPNSKISAPIYGSSSRPSPVYEPNIADTLSGAEKKPVVVVNSNHGVQEHIHHHYHHADNDIKGTGIVPNTFETGNNFPAASSFSPRPVYGGSGGGSLYGSTGNGFVGTSPSYGGGVDTYGSTSPFYKKEYNVKRPYTNNNYNSLSSAGPSGSGGYADKYPQYESPRLDNENCYCVPYDQCLPHEISRKDGLLIDPRSNNKNIEAIGLDDVVVTDGNGTIISHHVKRDDSKEEQGDSAAESGKEETAKAAADHKERRKRETSSDSVADDSKLQADDDSSSEQDGKSADESVQERRRRKLGGLGGSSDDEDDDTSGSGLRIKPTFGVSFGLPQGGGSYPVNPYGPNPHVNPYGGSFGGSDGLNLGLVNVNPLVSLQVSKDDEGEKVLKPFVNLHLTPNAGLVHKFGSLVHKFKGGYGYGGGYPPIYHQHYHSYKPSPPYYSRPPPSYGHGPPFKPFYEGYSPSYAPSFTSYRTEPPYDNGLYDHEPSSGPGGYVDSGPGSYSGLGSYADSGPESYEPSGYDDNDDYFRNAKSLSFDGQTKTDQQSNQGNTNVAFRDDAGKSFNQKQSDAPKQGQNTVAFPSDRRSSNVAFDGQSRQRRNADETADDKEDVDVQKRQAGGYYPGGGLGGGKCGPRQVCCRRPPRNIGLGSNIYNNRPGAYGSCGRRNAQGINGRIKNPVYVDGDSEFGEYPWHVAILKKDPQESVYVCGGTLIDAYHILTAAHCIKSYTAYDLRVRLGEWDVNHDVEFYPYVERDVTNLVIHPEFYAGTLNNNIAVLRMDKPVDFAANPHISPACLPEPNSEYAGSRCYTTGWGKDAFGDFGKYQNILKEVDVPVVSHHQCQAQLQQTRLGYDFKLHPGNVCAGGEEGKDACKGDGGGPLVCERGGTFQVVGLVSWGIGCGQYGVPGVYVKVAYYLDWIRQVTARY
ncbi:hypothetical protein M8J77_015477 [Diaphorina citri]|nr:hypothetical protein M8J77_015477 [Diaphorina citri]